MDKKRLEALEDVLGQVLDYVNRLQMRTFMIEILLDYITKKLNITDEELKQLAEEAKQKIIEMQKALVETAADEDSKIIEVADRLTLN